jgi:hypothetical protein
MKRRHSRIIIGTAVGAAAIAVVVDHTRQRLPEPEEQLASQQAVIILDEGEALPADDEVECSKAAGIPRQPSPCSL